MPNATPPAANSVVPFLNLFTTRNQRLLAETLFRDAARKKGASVASVLHFVAIELTNRCFRALGEAEGMAYHTSLCVLRDYRPAAEAFVRQLIPAEQAFLFLTEPNKRKRKQRFTNRPTFQKGGHW